MAEIGIGLFILSIILFFVGIIFLIVLSVMNKPLKPAGLILLGQRHIVPRQLYFVFHIEF